MISDYISDYLESNRLAWTAETMKSETSRLYKYSTLIDKGPEAIWQGTEHLAPYTRKTLFTRIGKFADYCIASGHLEINEYKSWMAHNRRLFKNAYTKNTPKISYTEAQALILSLSCRETIKKASQILDGGLRWAESFTITDGQCIGKGEKPRAVFVDACDYGYSYSYFRNHLSTIGLTPHDLRKIRATDLARKGLQPADLCKIFGWESFETASRYLAPLSDKKLQEAMQ